MQCIWCGMYSHSKQSYLPCFINICSPGCIYHLIILPDRGLKTPTISTGTTVVQHWVCSDLNTDLASRSVIVIKVTYKCTHTVPRGWHRQSRTIWPSACDGQISEQSKVQYIERRCNVQYILHNTFLQKLSTY